MNKSRTYSNSRIIENTQWGKIKVCQPSDPSDKLSEVFTVNDKGEENFLSFYDGKIDDNPDKIIAYIEMKMF